MGLVRCKIGDLIEPITATNTGLLYGPDDVRGMTITKEIIPTKADLKNTKLDNFIVVPPNAFIYNPRTHGRKIGLGFNDGKKPFIISWNNTAFKIKEEAQNQILPLYLFFHFNRDEWDRRACFDSWGSSTEVFTWDALCDMDIDLPSIEIQQQYVDIYNAILANQQAYEHGLEDLKLVCDGYLEELLEGEIEQLKPYIVESDERNENRYGIESVRGISIEKKFIDTKANMDNVSLSPYKVVHPGEFAYVPVTSRNGEKITLAYNDSEEPYIVSSSYIVFKVRDKNKLNPEYLFMYFTRPEFDRYARFNSWGSARETFDWADMQETKVPIPSIDVQNALAAIHGTWIQRRRMNETLKEQLTDICPVLIKGSIEEARREQG